MSNPFSLHPIMVPPLQKKEEEEEEKTPLNFFSIWSKATITEETLMNVPDFKR